MGKFAGGAVVAKCADTMAYSTVCADRKPLLADFAPLRADYYARFRGSLCMCFVLEATSVLWGIQGVVQSEPPLDHTTRKMDEEMTTIFSSQD
jgi:hypothetical protein